MNKFKKIINWIKNMFKKILGATTLDDEALRIILEKMGDAIIAEATRNINTAKGIIKKFEDKVIEEIKATDTKLDDAFIPFLDKFFATVDTFLLQRIMVENNLKLTVKNVITFILNEYTKFQRLEAR